jgi:L-threonylcarbamoyladenylate synthase
MTDSEISVALEALARGEIIGLPTDTVYGIAADPFDASATARLFRAKGRPDGLALPVLVADEDTAIQLGEIDERARSLASRFWPGALTIVVARRRDLGERELHLGGDPRTIGLRCPASPVARAVLQVAGPLAVTSANPHGRPPAATADELRLALGDSVSVVVDGGRCAAPASTVVSLAGGELEVLRVGALSEKEVRAVLDCS